MKRRRRAIAGAAMILAAGCLAGCATAPPQGEWGRGATPSPGWKRIGHAAERAALSPATWVPAAGAVLCGATEADRRLSVWARDHVPVFGSRDGAQRAGHRLLDATTVAYVLTALAAPSGREPGPWLANKAQGAAVGITAVSGTAGAVQALKHATRRERPNASDRLSFPSGHAASAAARATLAARNLEYLALPAGTRVAARGAAAALAAGCAWSRVEAGLHYPSDVLAGIALGHLLSAFLNDAFLDADRTALGAHASRHGAEVWLTLRGGGAR